MSKQSLFSKVKPKARGLALVVYAEPSFGKTSLGAYATEARMIMCGAEDGYKTLLQHNRVPLVPYCNPKSWGELLQAIAEVGKEEEPGKVCVIDGLGQMEVMCHSFVRVKQFNDNPVKFDAFQAGYEVSLQEIDRALAQINRLRDQGITTLILAHTVTKNMPDADIGDHDESVPKVHKYTKSRIEEWADALLYGKFLYDVSKGKDGSRTESKQRVLCTEPSSAHSAKNRLGLPARIMMPEDPAQMWPTLRGHLLECVKNGNNSNSTKEE